MKVIDMLPDIRRVGPRIFDRSSCQLESRVWQVQTQDAVNYWACNWMIRWLRLLCFHQNNAAHLPMSTKLVSSFGRTLPLNGRTTKVNGGTWSSLTALQRHSAMAFRRLGLPLAGLEPRRPKVASAGPAKERAEREAAQEPKTKVTLAVPAPGAFGAAEFVWVLKCGNGKFQTMAIWRSGNTSGIWAANSLRNKWKQEVQMMIVRISRMDMLSPARGETLADHVYSFWLSIHPVFWETGLEPVPHPFRKIWSEKKRWQLIGPCVDSLGFMF